MLALHVTRIGPKCTLKCMKNVSVYACSTANQLIMIALLIENNLKAVPFKPPVFGSFNCFFKKIGSVAFRFFLDCSMLKEHLELKKIISEKIIFAFSTLL